MGIPINKIKSANSSLFDNHHTNLCDTKKHSTDTFNIIAITCFFAYVISATIICGILIWLSILPLKYLVVLLAIVVAIATAIGFFTFKKSFGKIAKSICSLCSIILTVLFVIVFFYLNHTMGFMSSISASDYQISKYYVLVKPDSGFTTLSNLDNHSIAIYDAEEEAYQTAFSELGAKVTLKFTGYGSSATAANAFINGSADSFFIKSSLADVLSEIITGFNMETLQILDTIEVKTKIDPTASDINVTKDSFNIFISGIDTYGNISTVSRSDVNMIVTVNPRTHTILLTSIPRDYYVQLHDTTGLKDKLTHAGLYGINMSISTLQDLFNIKIDYYIRVNFDSTINLIDAIGGINVVPDFTFSRQTNGKTCYYEANAQNHLDGICALRYARERKIYGTGDLHRIQNQQDVIMAVIDKLTSSKVLLARYTDILSSMSGTLETNIPPSQIYKLVNEQLDSMPSWTIERISAEGYHIDAPTYTISTENLYVFVPYDESVSAVSAKIQEVMSAN